jgi:lipoprotein-anchoring transpeptidase ErfK/SrfK
VYGPYAFAISGFSENRARFAAEGSGIIGIHGTNEPEALGSEVSLGCVRVANDVITEMAQLLPSATPVNIRA